MRVLVIIVVTAVVGFYAFEFVAYGRAPFEATQQAIYR